MAEWTDIDDFAIERLRVADMNALLDNLRFLYDAPACAVRLQNVQGVDHAQDHQVSWDQAVWDSTGQMWDAGAPTKVLIVRDGVYHIDCATLWDGSSDSSKRAIFLHVNGARRRGVQLGAQNPAELQLLADTTLGAGDSIDIQVRQTSGDALDLRPVRTIMTVRWVAKLPSTPEA